MQTEQQTKGNYNRNTAWNLFYERLTHAFDPSTVPVQLIGSVRFETL